MYKIKQIPEDFYVKELIKLNFSPGNYTYFLLKKENLTTMQALELISNKSNVDIKDIGYAGNKDKNAIAEQNISIFKGNKNLESKEDVKNDVIQLSQNIKSNNIIENKERSSKTNAVYGFVLFSVLVLLLFLLKFVKSYTINKIGRKNGIA